MKTTMLITALAALLNLSAIGDDITAANNGGTILATSENMQGLRPTTNAAPPTRAVPMPTVRTFAFNAEIQALIKEGKTGAVMLEADCGMIIKEDGTYTDVSTPTRPIAYNTDGTEALEANYPDLSKAPQSVQEKMAILAKLAETDVASKKEGGTSSLASSVEG